MAPRQSKAKTSDVCESSNGGLWFPRHIGLNDHHKTKALVELTGDERISWHLEELWDRFMTGRQNGRLEFRARSSAGPLWQNLEIEKPIEGAARIIAQWSKIHLIGIEPMKWLEMLVRTGWFDFEGDENQGVISAHDWHEYGGKLAIRRAIQAEKKRIQRAQKAAEKKAKQGLLGKNFKNQELTSYTSRHVSPGHPSDIPWTSAHREEERREEKSIKTTTPNPLAADTVGNAAVDQSEPVVVGDDEPPRLRLVPKPVIDEARRWAQALEEIRSEGKRYAIQWLEKLRPLGAKDETFVLGVEDSFFRDWIVDNYGPTLERVLEMPIAFEIVGPPPAQPTKLVELTESSITEEQWWEAKEAMRAKAGLPAEKKQSWFSGWFRERKKERNALGSLTSYAVWLQAKDRTKYGWVDRHWPLRSFRSREVWESRLPAFDEAM